MGPQLRNHSDRRCRVRQHRPHQISVSWTLNIELSGRRNITLGLLDLGFPSSEVADLEENHESAGTMIMASHSMVEAADRVLWLQDDKVRALGDPEEVIATYAEEAQAKRSTIKKIKKGEV